MAIESREPVPQNAPGDFYVDRHICTRCCSPHGEAPDLLNDLSLPFDECYFRRQPQTAAETEQACQAVCISCVGALRYGGRETRILARLRELGVSAQADHMEQHDAETSHKQKRELQRYRIYRARVPVWRRVLENLRLTQFDSPPPRRKRDGML